MTRYCEYIMDTMKTDSFYLVRFQPMAAIAIHGIYIYICILDNAVYVCTDLIMHTC